MSTFYSAEFHFKKKMAQLTIFKVVYFLIFVFKFESEYFVMFCE